MGVCIILVLIFFNSAFIGFQNNLEFWLLIGFYFGNQKVGSYLRFFILNKSNYLKRSSQHREVRVTSRVWPYQRITCREYCAIIDTSQRQWGRVLRHSDTMRPLKWSRQVWRRICHPHLNSILLQHYSPGHWSRQCTLRTLRPVWYHGSVRFSKQIQADWETFLISR